MKEFMRLKSGDVRTPAVRAVRDKAPFKAAARGPFPHELVRRRRERMNGFAKEPQVVENLRTNPTGVRWLDLHNRLGNLELDQEMKTDGHLTTWTDLTSEANFWGVSVVRCQLQGPVGWRRGQ
jgi:hypothetical protein